MALFKWTEKYSIGVQHFDEQHRSLLDLIDELDTAIKAAKSHERLTSMFLELVSYNRYHLREEEVMLRLYKYPDLESHKSAHDKLREKVLDFKDKHERDVLGISNELLHFLCDWYGYHILKSDKDYGRFLNSKGVF